MFMHPWHTLAPRLFPTPASRLFTLHPSAGAIMCPPLIPAQPHALSKTTFIPQCTCIPHVSNSPTMPSVYRPTTPRVPVRTDHCHLSLLSFYQFSTLVTYTLFILWLRTQFKSPFLHQSHATQWLSPYLLECPFYNTSGHHNTPINSTVSVFLPTEIWGLNSPGWGKVAMKKIITVCSSVCWRDSCKQVAPP